MSERDYLHPLAQRVLVGGNPDARGEWFRADHIIFTPRISHVLAAVKEAVEEKCEKCPVNSAENLRSDGARICGDIHLESGIRSVADGCPLAAIRKAWKEDDNVDD